MSGQITPLRVARVHHDVGYAHAFGPGAGHGALLCLEDGGERGHREIGGEDGVFAAVGTAFGRARGIGIGQVLGQQLGARTLRRHARSAHGKHGKQAHAPLLPSSMAARSVRIAPRITPEATLKRRAFSDSTRASRSRLTLLPSFLILSPGTSTAAGGAPVAFWYSDWKSMSRVL